MHRVSIVSLVFGALVGCATVQEQIDSEIGDEGVLQLLYGTSQIRVFYDPIAERCVMYTSLARGSGEGIGVGAGIDTFDCDPARLRAKAAEQGAPNRRAR